MNTNDYIKQQIAFGRGLLDVSPEQDSEAFWNAVATAPIDPQMARGSWAGALLSMMNNGNTVYQHNRNNARQENAQWLQAIGPMKQLDAMRKQEEFDADLQKEAQNGLPQLEKKMPNLLLKHGKVDEALKWKKQYGDNELQSIAMSLIQMGPEQAKAALAAIYAQDPEKASKLMSYVSWMYPDANKPVEGIGPDGMPVRMVPQTVKPGRLPQRQNGNFGSLGQFESGNNPNAVSPKGAYGTPQITRDTFYNQQYYIPGKKFENDQDRIDVAKNKFSKDLQWGQENENAKWNVLGLNADQLARGAYFGGRQGVMNYSLSGGKTDPDDGNIPMSDYLKRTEGRSPFDSGNPQQPTQLAAGPGYTGGIGQQPQFRTKEQVEYDQKQQQRTEDQQHDFDKEDYQNANKSLLKMSENSQLASRTMVAVQQVKDIVEQTGYKPGPGNELKAKLVGVANALGIPLSAEALKNASTTTQVASLAFQSIIPLIRQMDPNPTQVQMLKLAESNFNAGNFPEAFNMLLSTAEHMASRTSEIYGRMSEHKKNNPKTWFRNYDDTLHNTQVTIDKEFLDKERKRRSETKKGPTDFSNLPMKGDVVVFPPNVAQPKQSGVVDWKNLK